MKMVLVTLVVSPFNHLTQLVPREEFIGLKIISSTYSTFLSRDRSRQCSVTLGDGGV